MGDFWPEFERTFFRLPKKTSAKFFEFSGRRDHEVLEKIYPPPRPIQLKLRDLKARSMSALLPKRTNSRHLGNVRFVPILL